MAAQRAIERIGVVGAGAMGRGIAQLMAQCGCQVLVFDLDIAATTDALTSIVKVWDRLIEKGRMAAADVETARARLSQAGTLAGFADCDLVIEAIVEKLDAKTALFCELEKIVAPNAILATNTSSLSVTEIAAACSHPGRIAGLHFFNPAPLMKLVEIVAGERTDAGATDALAALIERTGHRGVQVGDTPGFLVNHAGRAYTTEALKILAEGVAAPATIDAIAREAAGFRMGPFELLDLTGLDVSVPAMETIYRGFYQEPRLRPVELGRRRLAAGLLGRKTGEGFYRYSDSGEKLPADIIEDPAGALPERVAVAGTGWAAARLRDWCASLGVDAVDPAPQTLTLVAPVGTDTATQCARLQVDPEWTIGVDVCFGLDRHRTLATCPATSPQAAGQALALARKDGVAAALVRDSAGLVLQRILALVVNLSCDIAQQAIARPADIDTAVKLALAYPHGPLEWGDAIGPAIVLEILDGLVATTGDPRYRPSPWLSRRARLGLSLLKEET
jgi:3-hydroxybutyryl-CoA dehydrogenase